MAPLKQLMQQSPGSTLLPGSIEKAAASATYTGLAGNVPPSNNLAGSPPANVPTPQPLANAAQDMQVNPGAVPPDQMNPASPVAQKTKSKKVETKDGVKTKTKIKSVYNPNTNIQKIKKKVVVKSDGSVIRNKYKIKM